MFQTVTRGFALGLATGATCAAVCIPLLAPTLLVRREPSWRGSARMVGEFLIGRLVAYLAVGGIFGALGGLAVYEGASYFLGLANIPLGLAMILVAFSDDPGSHLFCRIVRRTGGHARMPLVLGLLTGISPCPPFVKAVHQVLTDGGAFRGALFFLAFYVATSLFVLPLIIIGIAGLLRFMRSLGFVVAGVAGVVFLTAGVQAVAPVRIETVQVHPRQASLKKLLPEATHFSKKLGDPPFYHEAYRRRGRKQELVGYVAVTTDAAPDVQGYGGPVPVLVATDTTGAIKAVKVLENQESPEYAEEAMSDEFARRFLSKTHRDALKLGVDIDGITGATFTSSAVTDGVRAVMGKLATDVFGASRTRDEGHAWHAWLSPTPWLFLGLLILAVAGERLRLVWMRYAVMVLSVLVLGFRLKAFFSVRFVVDIATRQVPEPSSAVWWAIVIPVLLVSLLLGRVYCGWLCPFGVLSEFVGRLSRSPLRPDARVDRTLRGVKYLVLLAVPLVFVIVADNGVLAFEPFSDVFTLSLGGGSAVRVAWLLFLLLGSLCVYRFFCRYLCPAGAAMAFVSRFRVFGRLKPKGCFECSECLTRCRMSEGGESSAPDGECLNCLACATCLRVERRRAAKEASS